MQESDKRKIIDITPTINENMAVFPGDVEYQRKTSLNFDTGSHFALSSLKATVHLGAHTDAPNHYHPDGEGIDKRDLDLYFGAATVIELKLPPKACITPQDLETQQGFQPRVLFKTSSFPDPYHWNENFNALSPELIHFLANQGVRLVGIDTPSIDLADAKDLLTHKAVFQNDMAILEGIVLDKVKPGDYVLCAFPLKLENADASPVRAVLFNH